MANGIEVDQTVTKRLVSEGNWPPGTLISMDGQIFMILGYNFWGWVYDVDDSSVFYDVALHHIGTGFVSSFPLMKVINSGKLFEEEK